MNNLWVFVAIALCLPLILFWAGSSPELGGPAQTLTPLQNLTTVYEVKVGDTLSAIASRFGIPTSWIMLSNNLTSTTIYPGQKLLVPKNGVLHTVKPGETVSAIAAAYGVSEEDVRKANGIAGEPQPGTRLYIPEPKTIPLNSSTGFQGFIWPVRGTISSSFGPRIHPIYGVPSFHTGIDIAVPEGTPVRAAAGGTVTFSGWQEGFGLLVVIDHENGYETYYGHLSRLLVAPGQSVSAGEIIALSGNTGLSTGPHLHFEVRYLGTPVDPRPLLP
ncbi:M23 family metallopeptidase [Candidatus Bipolaricaulota bacterium]|nr:M23 family metallopeptidase [Candidatus Bipolaricaulota bacterium]